MNWLIRRKSRMSLAGETWVIDCVCEPTQPKPLQKPEGSNPCRDKQQYSTTIVHVEKQNFILNIKYIVIIYFDKYKNIEALNIWKFQNKWHRLLSVHCHWNVNFIKAKLSRIVLKSCWNWKGCKSHVLVYTASMLAFSFELICCLYIRVSSFRKSTLITASCISKNKFQQLLEWLELS